MEYNSCHLSVFNENPFSSSPRCCHNIIPRGLIIFYRTSNAWYDWFLKHPWIVWKRNVRVFFFFVYMWLLVIRWKGMLEESNDLKERIRKVLISCKKPKNELNSQCSWQGDWFRCFARTENWVKYCFFQSLFVSFL